MYVLIADMVQYILQCIYVFVVLQRVCCSMLQRVAACLMSINIYALFADMLQYMLQRVYVCMYMLQRVCCSVFQFDVCPRK